MSDRSDELQWAQGAIGLAKAEGDRLVLLRSGQR